MKAIRILAVVLVLCPAQMVCADMFILGSFSKPEALGFVPENDQKGMVISNGEVLLSAPRAELQGLPTLTKLRPTKEEGTLRFSPVRIPEQGGSIVSNTGARLEGAIPDRRLERPQPTIIKESDVREPEAEGRSREMEFLRSDVEGRE